jgi:hypothetical protein
MVLAVRQTKMMCTSTALGLRDEAVPYRETWLLVVPDHVLLAD